MSNSLQCRHLFDCFCYPMTLISFFKRHGLVRASQMLAAGVVATLTGCAQTLPQNDKATSYSYVDNHDTALYQYAKPYTQAHPGKTGFYPLADGRSAFLARLATIEGAQKSLDVQYYIYRDDETSKLMTWYLHQAAERGVRVRLLLDDMQSRDDDALASLSAHPNVEVRLFNPFANRSIKQVGFLHDFGRLNRRMHNKAIIADGTFAITGGRNIGDEYFSANNSVEFGDFDLLLVGKVVPEVAKQFDTYWNSTPAIPIESLVDDIHLPTQEQLNQWRTAQMKYLQESEYAQSLKSHPMVQKLMANSLPFYWADATLNYDSPYKVLDKTNDLLMHDLALAIKEAKTDFVLVSPYFVPTKQGAELLANSAKKGLNVTVVTNSLASNDVFAVHGWYAKYRDIMLKGGVKLYETKVDPRHKAKRSLVGSSRTSLHAKSFVIDNRKVFVGSFNFDPRSAYLNTEMGIFVDSPEFAEVVNKDLNKLLTKTAYRLTLDDDGDIVWHDDETGETFTSEPDSSVWLKMGAWFAGALPIESQL
nr:phospholipase D family protein [Photobacterium damselae]